MLNEAPHSHTFTLIQLPYTNNLYAQWNTTFTYISKCYVLPWHQPKQIWH